MSSLTYTVYAPLWMLRELALSTETPLKPVGPALALLDVLLV